MRTNPARPGGPHDLIPRSTDTLKDYAAPSPRLRSRSPKPAVTMPKRPVTINRDARSRWTEMVGHVHRNTQQGLVMSVCTLTAEARVADFLRFWAESIAQRGLRTDQFTLRMSRAEMGNYLGMTLETVSRSLSRLAREHLIQFAERGRRDIRIPCVEALQGFVSRSLSPAPRAPQ